MAKITQDHNGCIGCGACAAVCPDFWEMNEKDGKAVPIKCQFEEGKDTYEFEVEEKDMSCNKEAAEVCPVQVIKIE